MLSSGQQEHVCKFTIHIPNRTKPRSIIHKQTRMLNLSTTIHRQTKLVDTMHKHYYHQLKHEKIMFQQNINRILIFFSINRQFFHTKKHTRKDKLNHKWTYSDTILKLILSQLDIFHLHSRPEDDGIQPVYKDRGKLI